MNKVERLKLVKAMEYVARQVNDELVFAGWHILGVADEDIKYGDLGVSCDDMDELSYYIQDDNFRELMSLFVTVMVKARKSGGLYCDGVTAV